MKRLVAVLMESRSTGHYDDHPKAPVYLGESRAEVEQTLRKARYGDQE